MHDAIPNEVHSNLRPGSGFLLSIITVDQAALCLLDS